MSEFVRESEDDFDDEPAKSYTREARFRLCLKFHNHDIAWEAKMRRQGYANCFRIWDSSIISSAWLVLGCSKHDAHG